VAIGRLNGDLCNEAKLVISAFHHSVCVFSEASRSEMSRCRSASSSWSISDKMAWRFAFRSCPLIQLACRRSVRCTFSGSAIQGSTGETHLTLEADIESMFRIVANTKHPPQTTFLLALLQIENLLHTTWTRALMRIAPSRMWTRDRLGCRSGIKCSCILSYENNERCKRQTRVIEFRRLAKNRHFLNGGGELLLSPAPQCEN
jgi:hypothetical protein